MMAVDSTIAAAAAVAAAAPDASYLSHDDDAMPAMVSSSDLFEGDILGDELIDIYNAAVVGAGDDVVVDDDQHHHHHHYDPTAHHGSGADEDDDGGMNEIPTLLAPDVDKQIGDDNQNNINSDESHPGTQVAVTAAAIDDGLGAFRPSTSFNDLTTLLPPTTTTPVGEVVAVSVTPPMTTVATTMDPTPPTTTSAPPAAAAAATTATAAAVAATTATTTSTTTATTTTTKGGRKRSAASDGNTTSPKKKSTKKSNSAPKRGSTAKAKAAAAAAATTTTNSTVSNVVVKQEPNSKIVTSNTTANSTSATTSNANIASAPAPPIDATAIVNDNKKDDANSTPNPLGSDATATTTIATTPAAATPRQVSSSSVSASQQQPPPQKANQAKPTVAAVPSAVAVAPAPAVVSPRPAPAPEPTVSAIQAAPPVPLVETTPSASASTASTATTPAPGTATEADFKSVAQAAVSSLISNAGSQVGKPDPAAADPNIKVDTSTAHIKALTGSNWVAVCSGNSTASASSTSVAAAAAAAAAANNDKANNRSRRQNLTPDERARQNRDRNREHARNTRLRKKAYVEELKRTLTELVAQRDAEELKQRHSTQRELEQREVRFRVIEEFLKLRGRNEANFARWAAILEDGFTLTMPMTYFSGMVHSYPTTSDGSHLDQVLQGVSDCMSDSQLFSTFLQTLGGETTDNVTPVQFVYQCDRKDFFMDNCNAVLEWTACSQGAVQKGAPSELHLKGTVRARFSPASNKLVTAVIAFDTGIITSQLDRLRVPIKEELDDHHNPHLHNIHHHHHHDVDAAAAAASEADAILDSLQMPHIEATMVPSNVTVVPQSEGSSSGASVTSHDDDDVVMEQAPQDASTMPTESMTGATAAVSAA